MRIHCTWRKISTDGKSMQVYFTLKCECFIFSTDGATTVQRDHAKTRMKVSDLPLLHFFYHSWMTFQVRNVFGFQSASSVHCARKNICQNRTYKYGKQLTEFSHCTQRWQHWHSWGNFSWYKLETVESLISFKANLYFWWCFELKLKRLISLSNLFSNLTKQKCHCWKNFHYSRMEFRLATTHFVSVEAFWVFTNIQKWQC